jgi:DNA gyrase subunit B
VTHLDAVRRRPGMYIGDTGDGSGLHNMIYELVDNAISEAEAEHCDRIEVALNADGSATVRDNGRGIPTEIHVREGVSAAEAVMTRLHASAHYSRGGRHGVGVAVVNALSEVLDLRIWRDGKEHFMRFRTGNPEAPLAGNADLPDGRLRCGTEITFLPDAKIFTSILFDFTGIERRLSEPAYLNSGVTIVLADKRGMEKKEGVLHI